MKPNPKTNHNFLFALLILTTLSACSEHSNAIPETTTVETEAFGYVSETETTDLYAGLPEIDFEKQAFHIIGQNILGRQNFWYEDVEGDIINDAIHTRDLAVSERLNIELEYTGIEDRGTVKSTVQKVINAGEDVYDLIITAFSDGINTLTTAEMLHDLREFPYLTLDSIYWNKSIYENMNFFGKQYFTTGVISPMLYQTPIVMLFNKRLAENYDIENLYQTVLDGKWKNMIYLD